MKIHILVAAAVAVPSAALAQGQAAAPAAAKPVTRAALIQELEASFGRIDTNKDGSISTAEADASQQLAAQRLSARIAQQAEQQFAQLDTDKNGQLSLAEFKAGAVKPQVLAGQQVIGLLDSNKDQKITLAEFRAKRLAQFDALDSNRDGTVTPQEMQAAQKR